MMSKFDGWFYALEHVKKNNNWLTAPRQVVSLALPAVVTMKRSFCATLQLIGVTKRNKPQPAVITCASTRS